MIVGAAATNSSATYLVGSIGGGFGFGAAFFGGLCALVAKIPPQHWAAVMSGFYITAYASLPVPAILADVVSAISSRVTFEIFGSVVAAIGVLVAFEARLTRPARPTHAPRDRKALLDPAS